MDSRRRSPATVPLHRQTTPVAGERAVGQPGDTRDDRIVVMSGRPDGESAGPPKRIVGSAMPLLCEFGVFLGYLTGGRPPRPSAAEGPRLVEPVATLRLVAGIAG